MVWISAHPGTMGRLSGSANSSATAVEYRTSSRTRRSSGECPKASNPTARYARQTAVAVTTADHGNDAPGTAVISSELPSRRSPSRMGSPRRHSGSHFESCSKSPTG